MLVVTGALAAGAFVLGACGGGSDDDASNTTAPVTSETDTPTVTAAPLATTTTTPPTTTTTIAYVTEGATVIVANASNVDGGAGRLTERLAAVGFTTGAALNSSEGQLATTKIYYDTANPEAKAVADSLAEALGGGAITVVEVGTPPPVDQPDNIGDATVIVAMGNDTADKSLAELQGLVVSTTEPSTDDTTDDSTDDTTDDTTETSSPDTTDADA